MNKFVKVVVCSIMSIQFLSAVDPELIRDGASTGEKCAPKHKRNASDDMKPPIDRDGIRGPLSPNRK